MIKNQVEIEKVIAKSAGVIVKETSDMVFKLTEEKGLPDDQISNAVMNLFSGSLVGFLRIYHERPEAALKIFKEMLPEYLDHMIQGENLKAINLIEGEKK